MGCYNDQGVINIIKPRIHVHVDLRVSRVKCLLKVENNRVRLALTREASSEHAKFCCVASA